MQIVQIPKDKLMEFLRITQYSADKKSPVIFEFIDDTLKCRMIDISIEVEYRIRLQNLTINNLIFALNASKLYDFLRKLDIKSDVIVFHIEKSSVFIEYSLGRAEIVKSEVPDRPGFYCLNKAHVTKYVIDSMILIENLRALKNCIGSDTHREQFSGLNIEFNKTLRMWATDGYVLCMSEINAVNYGEDNSCILPKRFIECIISTPCNGDCELIIYDTHCVFIQNCMVLTSPLINAKVLPIHKLFDNENNCLLQIEVDPQDFTKQIERVSIFSDDAKILSLTYKEDNIMLHSVGDTGNSGYEIVGSSDFKVQAGFYEPIKMSIGAIQLLHILKNFKGTTLIKYYPHKSNVTIQKKTGGYPVYVAALARKG